MTLHISISPEAETILRQRAAAAGKAPDALAAELVEAGVKRPPLDEFLAPWRAEVEATGMTEAEIGDMLERAKHDMRRSDPDREAFEALVIEAYRSGRFGSATVQRLLNHDSRWDTERWLAERGVALNYTLEDLEADRKTIDALFGKSA